MSDRQNNPNFMVNLTPFRPGHQHGRTTGLRARRRALEGFMALAEGGKPREAVKLCAKYYYKVGYYTRDRYHRKHGT